MDANHGPKPKRGRPQQTKPKKSAGSSHTDSGAKTRESRSRSYGSSKSKGGGGHPRRLSWDSRQTSHGLPVFDIGKFVEAQGGLEARATEDLPRTMEHTMEELTEVIREWVKSTSCSEHAATVRLCHYGSSALPGLIPPPVDLDVMCMLPLPLVRERDVFGLREDDRVDESLSTDSLVSKLHVHEAVDEFIPVPRGFVPCIKMKWNGVSIDLTFCSLPVELLTAPRFVPEDATQAVANAVANDTVAQRSLGAVHAAAQMRAIIPPGLQFGALHGFIRHWADARRIHGKHVGYNGGVSWAIMTAYVCVHFNTTNQLELLQHFFNLFTQWPWSVSAKHILCWLFFSGTALFTVICAVSHLCLPTLTRSGHALFNFQLHRLI